LLRLLRVRPPGCARADGRDPTYLFTNEGTGYTSLWKMLETNPAPSSDLTTSVNFPKNEDVMAIVEPGVAVTAALTALPTTFSQKGWRTGDPLTGDFDAGSWVVECVLDGHKYANVDITLHARLWKSGDPSGAGATALSDWFSSATQFIADKATDVIYSWSVSLAALTLTDEYLFIEFCMDVGPTLSGDAAGATIYFTCDETPDTTTRELLTTPAFTPAIIYKSVSDSGVGTDLVAVESSVALSDSGVGTDAAAVQAQIGVSDSGLGTDVVSVAVYTFISVSDSGLGTDAAAINVDVPISDSGVGTDAVGIQAQIGVSDSGLGTDVVGVAIMTYINVLDSGVGEDKVMVHIIITPAEYEKLKSKPTFTL